MIKFFRKIRQRLLTENPPAGADRAGRVSKYLLYAIGEIVLVVIGILIALQINNWNSQRIQDDKASRLAVRLLAETERNIIALEEDKARTLIAAHSSLRILHLMTPDYTNLNERMVDSLMTEMYLTPSYDFNSAVLSQALSTGEVANFNRDSLKNLIYSLPTQIERVGQNEESLRTVMNLITDLIADNYSLRKMDYRFSSIGESIGKSNLPEIDNRKILSMQRFENLVEDHYYVLTGIVNRYEEINSDLVLLSKLLDEQIDTER